MDTNLYEKSLIEARQILELAAVKMASQRRTFEDLKEMHNTYCNPV